MKVKIHDSITEDSIILEADDIDTLRKDAKNEVAKRGWKEPWSEVLTK